MLHQASISHLTLPSESLYSTHMNNTSVVSKKFIPGTMGVPNTLDGWNSLWRCVPDLSVETCEKILVGNEVPHNAMCLLDYRREVSQLCRQHGASGW